MPPRRKVTIITKEIKGTISTEEICKTDDNVSNQDDPLGFAAAVKRRGRKVAISAKEKGGADNVDVPNTEVSARSSKQKALHKILSMDKEDTDDCTTNAKPSLGETENDCSGAAAGAKHNNRKKQGVRAKKALKSIPEDVAMEASFVEQGSRIVSDEVKEISELCANEEKPVRGKRRSACAKENDQCKRRTELQEEQQKESQGKMVTCQKASRKRGGSSMLAPGHSTTLSPTQAPGNVSKKTTEDCLSMPTEIPDPSVLMSCTQEPTKPVSKKDQTLNVRSSTRTKKVVHYNEQTPKTAESKAQSANKRNTSAAKLLPGGAKRVKKDRTSTSEEVLALDSARATCVKRGRRHQKLSSPQNLVDKSSAVFINPRETGNKDEHREHQNERNSEQINSSSAFICVDLDKAVLLQTAQLESVKFSSDQEGAKLVSATSLEKTGNAGSIMHGERESDHIAHNQVSQHTSLSEKSVSDRKKINISKGKKVNSKRDTAQKAEGAAAEAKPKVLEAPLVQGTANSMADAEREEMCVSHLSIDAARKSYCESQNAGRKTFMRKRTLQGTAQQAKKQKISVLDTLPASLGVLVEGAAPAQNQEHEKVIQLVESQGWNAVDITNSESRVEHSSEKKRREEIKRKRAMKRAMKFDALPVGFGLGISCWSTPPWANQSIEGVEVADSSVVGFQVQSESPMEDAKKQLCLQETAMSNDATNTSLGHEDTHHALKCSATEEGVMEVDSSIMGFQIQMKSPIEEAEKELFLQETAMSKDALTSMGLDGTYYALPCSATTMQASNFSVSDAERLPGSGIKPVLNNVSNHGQDKAKVKRQVARKTKTSKALLIESIPAGHTGSDNSILDKENLEPKLHGVHNEESEFKMSRSSRRRTATAGKEKTARTKKN